MIEGGGYLSDPGRESAMATAVGWLERATLGTLASVIAVLAVAAIGLLMLSGRLHLRRGVTTVIGCFILFGSGVIADAVLSLSDIGNIAPQTVAAAPLSVPPSQNAVSETYDPYAGASVPVDH